jgi:AraC-like DNA-binding protein
MRIATRPLLVLHHSQTVLAALGKLAGPEYRLQILTSWGGLRAAILDSTPSAIVVVDPYLGEAHGHSAALRLLAADFPSVPIIGAVSVRPESAVDLHALAHSGVVDFIAVGHDDTVDGLRLRLDQALARPFKALLDSVLPAGTSARGRVLIERAAEVVVTGESATRLAATIGISRRTLLRWCYRAGLPSPRRLFAWLRMLLAAELLDDPGRSVLGVATTCGYSSDSGLRRVMHNFLDTNPSDLREGDAFAAVSTAFAATLNRSARLANSAASRARGGSSTS